MSYVIDVYRGEIEPHPSYLGYLLFVAFFPHLVAGPSCARAICCRRSRRRRTWDERAASEALFLIATGLLKKIAISD